MADQVNWANRKTYDWTGVTLTSEQVAQIAYQVGFRGQALVMIVGLARRESGNRAGVHGTERPQNSLSGDRGLLQINYVHDDRLMRMGVYTSRQQLFDPVVNLKAAYVLSQQGSNFSPWTAAAGGWSATGSATHGVNLGAAQQAVNNAQNQGLLGQAWQGGGATGTPGETTSSYGPNAAQAAANSGTSPAAPITLPSDAKVVKLSPGGMFAVFSLGAGVWTHYAIPSGGVNLSGVQVENLTKDQFWKKYKGSIHAGDVGELASMKSDFGTYGKWWETVLLQTIGSNNPAVNDPEVRRVLAEYAARPDMSEAELQNRLKATTYWNNRSQSELEWNSLSEGERESRRQETASRMAQTWFQFVGENIKPGDPRLKAQLEAVASGKLGFGAWTETHVKAAALRVPESPWNRTLRENGMAKREHGVSIENTALQVKDTLERWGLKWSEKTVMDWAKMLVEKNRSDDDLMKHVKGQAANLYSWKDPETETATAAAPWLETYRRVMEDDASLFTPDVAKALTAGQPLWEFEQSLKRRPKWMNTKNARAETFEMASEASRLMGYTAV